MSGHGCWDCEFSVCIGEGDCICGDVDINEDEARTRGLVATKGLFVREIPCGGRGWEMRES